MSRFGAPWEKVSYFDLRKNRSFRSELEILDAILQRQNRLLDEHEIEVKERGNASELQRSHQAVHEGLLDWYLVARQKLNKMHHLSRNPSTVNSLNVWLFQFKRPYI